MADLRDMIERRAEMVRQLNDGPRTRRAFLRMMIEQLNRQIELARETLRIERRELPTPTHRVIIDGKTYPAIITSGGPERIRARWWVGTAQFDGQFRRDGSAVAKGTDARLEVGNG